MLYKVTPSLAPPEPAPKKVREPGAPKKRRKSAVYDHEGHEVLITLMCLKCKTIKPLMQFGLRKMPDGAIRNQPWCRGCRGGATAKKPKVQPELAAETTELIEPAQIVADAAGIAQLEAGVAAVLPAPEPSEAAVVAAAPIEPLAAS